MLRRLLVLGLVVMVVSTLAAVAAVRTSSEEAGAQGAPQELGYLCLDPVTRYYRGSFTPNCPSGQQLITIPDDFPITLCSAVADVWFRAPVANGECQPPNSLRIDLPSTEPVILCLDPVTDRLRPPVPYPGGTCGTGRGAGIPVILAQGFGPNPDAYQTLGNVDIDVPAASGVLANDGGAGWS